MPDTRTERELNDRLWDRVRPLLPPPAPHPKGGRPVADDRACLDGIVYLPRNGRRWRQVPACYPSGVTGRRRHKAWTEAGVRHRARKLVPAGLGEAGRLDTSELIVGGTFAEAERGVPASARAGSGRGRRSNSSSSGRASHSGRRRTGRASTR